MKDTDLAGRCALVTGASRGIGRAIALELASHGAHVILSARDTQRLEETRGLVAQSGGRATVLAGDLTADTYPSALDRTGHAIDVVVHNATAFPPYGALEDVPRAEVTRAFEVGVLAPMRITAHLLPNMKARGFGRVVFLGSIAGTTGAVRQAPYAAAKAALHGLVKSLALEGAAHGVTCNVVEPGLVLTERVLAAIPVATREALIAGTPTGRAGTPEEIAAVVGFLVSPRASYVTGACVPVTGGLGLGLT